MNEPLTYAPAGITAPADPTWTTTLPGFRRFERTVPLGHGTELWDRASEELLSWGVKRRSGFHVTPLDTPDLRVTPGANFRITAGWGPIAIHEPVRVVAVVDTPDRAGFAYGTLPGHPVSGEEAFILHRTTDDRILLTLRSLARPAPNGPWRTTFPLLLVAQRYYRHRYLRALAD
ncbi:DUF1990 family protein [Nocardia seriolae]|uniref:UPF0548 protein n=1 Tax=Nocardia seriolae TaxID=37332 RepID=A0A0B8N0E4_9NOCA|nr:DUF1990 domain-containing protein [Nocardia seriolae]APB00138.1 UPF0548 protein [Nocardia seriolae]MTJ64815.1 DUF1990 family protein [Nocardia seriolae]MTJ72406.1 DUF1990 family protein [Nocardia seriolae]MTJ89650.1 DUF1990 family protein [Nocardia seriolae]MTK33625.1 DUF1990 family protein [Nocardia seriolae]